MGRSPERWEISKCHSIAVKCESLREEYMSLSEGIRGELEAEIEVENQFLNILHKLSITAGDMADIAEERKSCSVSMDCCYMDPAAS